jgi:hypothetical protein
LRARRLACGLLRRCLWWMCQWKMEACAESDRAEAAAPATKERRVGAVTIAFSGAGAEGQPHRPSYTISVRTHTEPVEVWTARPAAQHHPSAGRGRLGFHFGICPKGERQCCTRISASRSSFDTALIGGICVGSDKTFLHNAPLASLTKHRE